STAPSAFLLSLFCESRAVNAAISRASEPLLSEANATKRHRGKQLTEEGRTVSVGWRYSTPCSTPRRRRPSASRPRPRSSPTRYGSHSIYDDSARTTYKLRQFS